MVNVNPLQTKHWLALVAVLFTIVLIAHLAIITSSAARFNIKKSTQIAPLTTRMIELPAIVPVVKKAPDNVPMQPPKRSKVAKPAAPKPPLAAPAPPPMPAETMAISPPPNPNMPDLPDSPDSPEEPETKPVTQSSAPAETLPATSASAPTTEAGLPPPMFAGLAAGLHTYKVIFTINGVENQGFAAVRWRNDGEKYDLNLLATYTLLFKTFNVIEWSSTGQMTSLGLQPVKFSDKRRNRSEVAAHFNYTDGKVTFSANTLDALLQAGAQDRVSVIWQLAGMLAADPARYPPGAVFTVQTVSATEAQPWLFTINEPETLNLASGSQIALRLTRNPRREFDQKIELWFATGMNYQPVRFRFTEINGDYLDAVWQSVQP